MQSVSCAVLACPHEAAFTLVQKLTGESYHLCTVHKEKWNNDWLLLKRWTFQGNCAKERCLAEPWCVNPCTLDGCKHYCNFHDV